MISSQILSQIELFEGVPQGQLAAIAGIGEEVTYQEGETIFREGDNAEQLYILLQGNISIQVQLSSRPERITVSVISQPNQSFGWSGVVAPYHYTASALCKTGCRLLAINGQQLLQVLQEEPASGFIVMQRIAGIISSRLRNSRMALLKSL
jgi:CRP-like cAMP-binding protein